MMRRRTLPTLLLPLLLASPVFCAPAVAAGLSLGHEFLPNGTALGTCMARATAAVQMVGLRLMNPTTSAVWAENAQQDQLYVLYCIPERGVLTITGAGDRFEDVDPWVTRLREAYRSGGAGTGARIAPAPMK